MMKHPKSSNMEGLRHNKFQKITTLFMVVLIPLCVPFLLSGQTESFIIQGHLSNCPEKQLQIFIADDDGQTVIDTIHLDEDGRFYFETYEVKHPQQTSLQQNRIQINDIYIAPGYNLTLRGDGTDFQSLLQTLEITGIGAETNQYKLKIVAAHQARPKGKWPHEMDGTELLVYLKDIREMTDSVVDSVFNKPAINDPYLDYFANLIRLDNEVQKLYYLLDHVNSNKSLDYGQSVAFVRDNYHGALLDDISKDEYLWSSQYKNWGLGEYIKYLRTLDERTDSTLVKEKGYLLAKIDEHLTGKVRDYYLNEIINGTYRYNKTLEQFNSSKERLKPYIAALANEDFRQDIYLGLAEKEAEIVRSQAGSPAPDFTLQSDKGGTYSLSDFKGKVVYIDLWASWCIPCRQEHPSFKALYDKYKEDDRVVFVGIAVSDGKKEWQRALEEDQPDWLQLYDAEGVVNKAYVANAIPKFILVDKQGNIVSFDAPRPSSGSKLEELLDAEIAK